MPPEKTVAIRISEDLQRRIKFRLVEKGTTLKDYIVGLIEQDLNEGTSGPSVQDLQARIDRAVRILENTDA